MKKAWYYRIANYMSGLAAAYLVAILARNSLGVFLFVANFRATWQLSTWWCGTALALAIGAAPFLLGKTKVGCCCIVLVFISIGSAETVAYGKTRFLGRRKTTMERMLLYGRGLALGRCDSFRLRERIVIPPSGSDGLKDGWGHPFVYRRIDSNVALLVAPGPDGKITRQMVTAETDPQDCTFNGFAEDKDIVMRIEQGSAEFMQCPAGPAKGDWRVARLLFGTLAFLGEDTPFWRPYNRPRRGSGERK